MLTGLLRMRLKTGSAFGLAHILWKQVRLWQSLLAVILPNLLNYIFVRKGLIWLLLATVAEVPSAVRLAILFHLFLLLIAPQTFMLLNLNGEFLL